MRFYERISYCPRCGRKYRERDFDAANVLFICAGCGDGFYQNSVPSATVVVPRKNCPGEVLLLTRATDPQRGKLALPGGFLRYGEIPAEAASREAREEILLDVTIERLLCANLVEYEYQGAQMSVLELAFLAQPVDGVVKRTRTTETSCLDYYDVSELLGNLPRFAFPEQRRVLEVYLSATV